VAGTVRVFERWTKAGGGLDVSMHDDLYCDATLPDTAVPPGACFETKAFPMPFLFRYRITKAGRLIDALGRDLECDGSSNFIITSTGRLKIRGALSIGPIFATDS
jgi:hypothetical protein